MRAWLLTALMVDIMSPMTGQRAIISTWHLHTLENSQTNSFHNTRKVYFDVASHFVLQHRSSGRILIHLDLTCAFVAKDTVRGTTTEVIFALLLNPVHDTKYAFERFVLLKLS